MKKILPHFVILLFLTVIPFFCKGNSDIKASVIEQARRGIVVIHSYISDIAYSNFKYTDIGTTGGTGFLADKQLGLIVTNSHVVGTGAVGKYYVTFYNGQRIEANLVYYDLWQDYAILKIDSNILHEDIAELSFTSTLPQLNEQIFTMGHPSWEGFIWNTAYFTHLYKIEGLMPQHSYVIALKNIGGMSGSPVLNQRAEVVALVHGGSECYTLALKADYIIDALKAIKNKSNPIRKHIGLITEIYSLAEAVDRKNFPKKLLEIYNKEFPCYRGLGIRVRSLINTGTSSNIEPGDIIWEVNDNKIGASLYDLDRAMDTAAGDSVVLTIYRKGEKIIQEAKLYDINKNKITKLVQFGGAIFFKADDRFSFITGAPIGSLSMGNIKKGSSFDKTYLRNPEAGPIVNFLPKILGEYRLSTIENLIDIIPQLQKQKYLTFTFQPYSYFVYGSTPITAQTEMVMDIEVNQTEVSRVLTFNPLTLSWEIRDNRIP